MAKAKKATKKPATKKKPAKQVVVRGPHPAIPKVGKKAAKKPTITRTFLLRDVGDELPDPADWLWSVFYDDGTELAMYKDRIIETRE